MEDTCVMPTTDEVLNQQRENLLRRLVELASSGRSPADEARYRQQANRIVEEITKTERLMGLLGSTAVQKYVRSNPAEAVVQYISEEGVPRSREQIISELIKGGLPATSGTISRVITMFINGPPLAKDRAARRELRELNGLIGLISWGDELFSSSPHQP